MKNIHVIPTNKPSRLHFDGELFLCSNYQVRKRINYNVEGRNIYITSDEEAEEGDWVIYRNSVFKIERGDDVLFDLINVDFRKVILTTDQDLIKDGVQAIDDEFLEWFVENPTCEEVEVIELKYKSVKTNYTHSLRWGIIIPQEEHKPEFCDNCNNDVCCCIIKERRMYSEEDLKRAYLDGCEIKLTNAYHVNKWLEQFKNKQQ